MAVHLTPSSQLSFQRPLTSLVKRTLSIANPNDYAVAFKVKTTAPKLYCVRPNSGKVEPHESVEVLVMLLAMKEDPPASIKCKDKFLVQSTPITPEKAHLALADIWLGEDTRVQQQKIKVAWLPVEGSLPPTEEHDESTEYPSMSTMTQGDDSRYETVRHMPSANGFSEMNPGIVPMPVPDVRAETPPIRTMTPAASYHDTPDEHHELPGVSITASTPPPTMPVPSPAASPDAKLAEAHAEIQRLTALLASMPQPAASELRRRKKSVAADEEPEAPGFDTEMMTDGYSPQSVAMIAFAVFLFTYLFF